MKSIYFRLLFLLLISATAVIPVKAQFLSPGGGIIYGSEIEQAGVNLRAYYNLPDKQLRGGVDFSYFFPKNQVVQKDKLNVQTNLWALNLSFHYLFPVDEKIKVYPMAGLNMLRSKVTYEETHERRTEPDYTLFTSYSGMEWGANIGVGGQYKVEENIKPFLEVKYVLSQYDQFVFTAGTYFLMR